MAVYILSPCFTEFEGGLTRSATVTEVTVTYCPSPPPHPPPSTQHSSPATFPEVISPTHLFPAPPPPRPLHPLPLRAARSPRGAGPCGCCSEGRAWHPWVPPRHAAAHCWLPPPPPPPRPPQHPARPAVARPPATHRLFVSAPQWKLPWLASHNSGRDSWAISTFSPVSLQSSNGIRIHMCVCVCMRVCVCVHWHSTEWTDMWTCQHSAHYQSIPSTHTLTLTHTLTHSMHWHSTECTDMWTCQHRAHYRSIPYTHTLYHLRTANRRGLKVDIAKGCMCNRVPTPVQTVIPTSAVLPATLWELQSNSGNFKNGVCGVVMITVGG